MKDAIAALRSKDHIQSFEDEHPDYYLANLFIPDYDDGEQELSYYNPDDDAMITVSTTGSVSDEQDILRSGHDINELSVTEDTLSFDEALNHARSTFDAEEGFQRIMGVLQTRDQTEWNITFITKSFDVYNARLNATDGDVLSTSEDDVMSWIQGTT
jgi:uncharacterized membrane protein YkoI